MVSTRCLPIACLIATATLLMPTSAVVADSEQPTFRAGVVSSLPNLGYESWGLGIDNAGNIYQAMVNRDQSQANTYLAKITPDGSIVHLFQGVSVSFSVQPDGTIYYTAGIDNSPLDGNLYRYSAGVSTLLASGIGAGTWVHGIAVLPNGDVYVGNCLGGGNICKVSNGQVSQIATNVGDLRAAIVDASGRVLMTDCSNGRVVSVSPSGSIAAVISGLNYPQGITIDIAGNIWVGASFANQVYQYSPTGERLQTFSNLYDNVGIAVSTTGVVYVGLWYGGIADLGIVAPSYPTVPSPPAVHTPTSPASGQLTWTWSPSSNGGSPVTFYSWSGACSGSGLVTSVTCSNLNLENDYLLTVVSTNAIGTSTPGTGRYAPFDGVVKLATQNIWNQSISVCALTTSGRVICFGDTSQVGQPASDLRFIDIAGAAESYCGVTTTHSIVCWGNRNLWGQLSAPVRSDAASIYGTNVNYCALTTSGQPVCWGLNDRGQTSAPVASGFDQIVVGRSLGCARSSTTLKLTCWGDNQYTQSSDNGKQIRAMAMSDYAMCQIELNHALNCAISNLAYGIGQPATGVQNFSAEDVRLVATIGDRVCYITIANSLVCSDSAPQHSFAIREVTQLIIGRDYGCLVMEGRIGCWGGISVPDTLPGVVAPSAPTVATPTNSASGQMTWTWSPNATGGSAITSYSWSGACSGSGLVTTVTCSGLTGGTSYTLYVTATNGVGTSGSGSRSGTALAVPNAPIANASPANGVLNVSWTAPSSNGGTPVTGYTATATAAGRSYSCTSTTLKCSIIGLTNGTTYQVSVVATNAKGSSTPSNTVSIYPAPDTKFLAYSPNSVVLVKSNFQVLVANAKAGALVTVTAAGATKTCTANAVGECSVMLNSSKSAGWVIVASYVDGKKTVSTATSYRVNIAIVTVSSVQVAKGKSFTVKISSGAPGTKFQVATSDGTSYSANLTSAGAGTITVVTKAKGTLTLTISDNGTLLQTTTVAVV